MRKEIPNNNISKDYKSLLDAFINQISKTELNNIISIFLTGSFARGEASENSDVDIWCVFNELNNETLNKVGLISQNLSIAHNQLEINPQCLTLDEFNSGHFSKFLAYPIIFLEAILLLGEDIATRAVRNCETEKAYKEFLAEILLSIRHYIAVNEPTDKLTFHKIKTWVLKPLMFALRLERYLVAKQYPLTSEDLLNAYDKPPISVIYFTNSEKWDTDIQTQRDNVLFSLHEEVKNILNFR